MRLQVEVNIEETTTLLFRPCGRKSTTTRNNQGKSGRTYCGNAWGRGGGFTALRVAVYLETF